MILWALAACGDGPDPGGGATAAGADPAVVRFAIAGAAEVWAGVSWTGTETWTWTRDGADACLADRRAQSHRPLTTCADCLFAFDVVLSETEPSGDGCADLDIGTLPRVAIRYGLSEEERGGGEDTSAGDTGAAERWLMLGGADRWVPWIPATWEDVADAQGTLAYEASVASWEED